MQKSVQVAFCGILAALCTVCMFLTGLIPMATMALPALAGVLLIAVVVELGQRWSWAAFGVSVVLSFFLTADKEALLLYLIFFGYYPTVKAAIENGRKKSVSWVLKFALFNAAMIAEYFAAVWILQIPQESFTVFGHYVPWVILLLGNVVFVVYDWAVSGMVLFYWQRLHPFAARFLQKNR